MMIELYIYIYIELLPKESYPGRFSPLLNLSTALPEPVRGSALSLVLA